MGGSLTCVSRQYMCCSLREKQEPGSNFALNRLPQFRCVEAEVHVDCPCEIAFAPLYQQEAAVPRRLAVASKQEVCVYHLPDYPSEPGEPPRLVQTHVLKIDPGQVITRIRFNEDDSSRHLIIAAALDPTLSKPDEGASLETAGKAVVVQVWQCDGSLARSSLGPDQLQKPPIQWKWGQGCVASLDEHSAPVRHLVGNKTYLLTGDSSGECRLWQKTRSFSRRSMATLHPGSMASLEMDRLFVYSIAEDSCSISAWSLPDLTLKLVVPVDLSQEAVVRMLLSAQLPAVQQEPFLSARSNDPPQDGIPNLRLARVNLFLRPPSRWAGCPGTTRGPRAPRGSLFVAGVLNDEASVAGAGAGVLMEWNLAGKPDKLTGTQQPCCRSMQIAHESAIVDLVYGPYDNGPLVSCCASGMFRIWESLTEGLCFSQQLQLSLSALNAGIVPAMAVEHPCGIYAVVGTRMLSVWHRHLDNGGM